MNGSRDKRNPTMKYVICMHVTAEQLGSKKRECYPGIFGSPGGIMHGIA